VHWSEAERLEDQELERAGEELAFGFGHITDYLYVAYSRDTAMEKKVT
jgi:hypothetical protein